MEKKDYRFADAISHHRAIHANEDEPLLAIVYDKRAGECSQMESWSFLIDFRVAQLKANNHWDVTRVSDISATTFDGEVRD